jgi:hypothetical protein
MATAMGNGNGNGDGVGNDDKDGNGNCNGNGHGKGDDYKGRVASSCAGDVLWQGQHLASTPMDTKESAFTIAASWV